jgi:hypothetical protein
VSDLDLSKAIDAGTDASLTPQRGNPNRVAAIIRAALPYILEALAEKADADGLDYGYVFEDWLRAKAEEARDD